MVFLQVRHHTPGIVDWPWRARCLLCRASRQILFVSEMVSALIWKCVESRTDPSLADMSSRFLISMEALRANRSAMPWSGPVEVQVLKKVVGVFVLTLAIR
ncbi:MAG: hypothetical protein MZW92_41120, partial [Comamonadaceae bacterium]|nr:hypothetical protein [Comamonadaceae bacterium]